MQSIGRIRSVLDGLKGDRLQFGDAIERNERLLLSGKGSADRKQRHERQGQHLGEQDGGLKRRAEDRLRSNFGRDYLCAALPA